MWNAFLWKKAHSSNTEALHTDWFVILSLLWSKQLPKPLHSGLGEVSGFQMLWVYLCVTLYERLELNDSWCKGM